MICIFKKSDKTNRIDVDFGLGTVAISLFDDDKTSLVLHVCKRVSKNETGKTITSFYKDFPASHEIFLNFMSVESIDYLIKMLNMLKERKLNDIQNK